MPFTLYTNEIVIAGISAKLPNSANMEEFRANLLAGADMVTEERPRWEPGFLGLPTRNGRIMELDKFDARFFSVHTKQAQSMDPQLRMLLELTYEAIVDAGVNPAEIRGSSTGVFIGVSGSDSETFQSFHPDFINGYVSPGHHRSMLANRISYTFDLRGPSFPIDTACSSSMLALESAVNAIRLGKCEAAIVGGSNLILHPYPSYHSHKLGMFSPDGKCKSFDASGDGYVRSEGVAVIFIQKKDVARRAYASILNIRSNTDGFKDNGVTFPSGKVQKKLLEATYAEVDIDPVSINYFEAHGTGTAAGDPQELNSVTEIFCQNRGVDNPLLIGSVKSNMGHLEPVAGLASIAKMIVAVQEGRIPANLHYSRPNPEIPALADGRLKVVTENVEWNGETFGINSFGWGGANVHAILQGFPRKTEPQKQMAVPLLVPFSGRTKESVRFGLDRVTAGKTNRRELVALTHEIHKLNIAGHSFRGFALIDDSDGGLSKIQEVQVVNPRPQVWFIFAGMGSQSQISNLLAIKPFRNSIEKSTTILREHVGFDLMSVLTSTQPGTFEVVTNSFVNIVAVQIALVDTLKSIGITPDGIFGHSVGEVSCSYADGCLSQEETILLAYWRGRSLLDSNCVPGGMAAIGMGLQAASVRCPPGVVVACQNTADSVTISGPMEPLEKFVDELKAEGIFARLVPTSGFAFHSKLIQPASEYLREKLQNVFPTQPKARSTKWISTSVRGGDGSSDSDSSLAATCSIEYHLNNLVSPVYFADALAQIPENSVVIELAPHSLLQALLRRGLPASCTRIGLTKRDASNHARHILENLGSLYLAGLQCNFSGLYDKVQFPVPANTPMIGPMVKWDHSFSWDLASFSKPYKTVGETILDVSLANEEYAYLEDHVIDGRNICPVMMYIYAVWKSFATLNQKHVDQFPVVFESVHFQRPILLSKESTVRFFIQILESSGRFEIEEGDSLLASGIVRRIDATSSVTAKNQLLENRQAFSRSVSQQDRQQQKYVFKKADLYKEMKLRGYEYKPRFMGMNSLDFDGTCGTIDWTASWVPFLDSMLHTLILGHRNRNLDLPAGIQKLIINPLQFLDFYKNTASAKVNGMPIVVDHDLNKLTCPGIELHSVGTDRATRKPLTQKPPMYNQAVFTPYKDDNDCNNNVVKELIPASGHYNSLDTRIVTFLFDIILDNSSKLSIECVEVLRGAGGEEGEEEAQAQAVSGHLQEIDAFRVEYKLRRIAYVVNTSANAAEGEGSNEEWANAWALEGTTIVNVEDHADAFQKIQERKDGEDVDVIIIHDAEQLALAKEKVPNYGFIILVAQAEFSCGHAEGEHLQLISAKPFGGHGRHAFLFRKVITKPEDRNYQIIHVHTKSFEWFEQLKKAMVTSASLESDTESETSKTSKTSTSRKEFRILLLSLNDSQSGIVGLVKCLRKEPGGSAIRYIFSQDASLDTNTNGLRFGVGGSLQNLDTVFKRVLTQDLVHNVIDKHGRYGFHYHQQFFPLTAVPFRQTAKAIVDQQIPGDAQSFGWVEAPLSSCRQTAASTSPEQHQQHTCMKEVDVHYAVLNLAELQAASNALANANLYNGPQHANAKQGFAIEYSGVGKCRRRFIGISNTSGFASTVCVDEAESFFVELPDHVSLAAGVTMPMAYLAAIYTLLVRGHVTSKDSILIHDGCSPVGQAALHIAKHVQADVFTTIETKEQKQFLQRTFPELSPGNILSSSDNSFESALLKTTHGIGVSVVLNTLTTEEGFQASIRALADGGRFIDIGRRSKTQSQGAGNASAIFAKNVEYHNIQPDALMHKENPDRAYVIEKFVELLHAGALQPINSTVFGRDELSLALRSNSNQTQTQMGKIVIKMKEEATAQSTPTVFPRTYFNPDKVYILAGGLGDTGLEMVNWMITRGAKKLILCNRSGVSNSYQQYHVRNWIESGIEVKTPKIDITSMKDVESLKDLIHGRPVGGIFNLSMVLRDSFIASMSYEDFTAAVKPKIMGTRNLDQFARKYCGPELEYFVAFSSVTSARGNEGQCNYGFGNSMTERLIEERVAEGLPGMAIQFGPIGDVGYVEYGMGGSSDDKIIAGTNPQRIRSVITSLDKLLREPTGIKSSTVIAQKKSSAARAGRLSLLESIAGILGLNEPSKLDQSAKLGELGMDSLMAVEMRQMIERDFGLFHSIQELRTLTVGELIMKSKKK